MANNSVKRAVIKRVALCLLLCPMGVIGSFTATPRIVLHGRCRPDNPSSTVHQTPPSYSSSSSSLPKSSSSSSSSSSSKSRPRSKTRRSSSSSPKSDSARRARTVSSRPQVTDYPLNRNPNVQRERFRAEIGCPHFGNCNGCEETSHVANVDVVKSARLYFSSAGVRRKRNDVRKQKLNWRIESSSDDDDNNNEDTFFQVVIPSSVTGWRTQAKLAVAPKSSPWVRDGCTFGLYKRDSHTVLSIPECSVHHPAINRAVQVLEKATNKVGTPAFTESTREGGLRYVQLQVERSSGKISLALVWNADALKNTQPSLSRLAKELSRSAPDLWHSMWCHCNDGIGNNIFSRNPRNWYRLSGPEFVREPIPSSDVGWFYFSPLTFRQGNLDGFDVLAVDVAREVPGNAKVCELYAGVGVLGLTALAYHSASGTPLIWIRCSDENPANPRGFQRAVDSLPSHVTGRLDSASSQRRKSNSDDGITLAELATMMRSGKSLSRAKQEQKRPGDKTSYKASTAADALLSGQALGADVLIVDPPRKGLEVAVLAELCKPFNPEQPYVESSTLLAIDDNKVNWCNDITTLIYVSCRFESLARDLDKLLSSPAGWLLERATGYILFCGSDHVETVCILKRQ